METCFFIYIYIYIYIQYLLKSFYSLNLRFIKNDYEKEVEGDACN